MRLAERKSMENYDPEKDPIVQGETLISGAPDLAERIDALGDIVVRARRDYERVRESNLMLDNTLDG